MRCKNWFLSGCALLATLGGAAPALAQNPTRSSGEREDYEGDIIVTARRRDETAQETPVALTVLDDTAARPLRRQGGRPDPVADPGTLHGESTGAMGGTISLRGIGSGDSMAFIDQAVSSNVDGVPDQLGPDPARRADGLETIEVLRGPQALFFGKNSPGGSSR
jgi:outer membrane receptor protein involved in Fe transport